MGGFDRVARITSGHLHKVLFAVIVYFGEALASEVTANIHEGGDERKYAFRGRVIWREKRAPPPGARIKGTKSMEGGQCDSTGGILKGEVSHSRIARITSGHLH